MENKIIVCNAFCDNTQISIFFYFKVLVSKCFCSLRAIHNVITPTHPWTVVNMKYENNKQMKYINSYLAREDGWYISFISGTMGETRTKSQMNKIYLILFFILWFPMSTEYIYHIKF